MPPDSRDGGQSDSAENLVNDFVCVCVSLFCQLALNVVASEYTGSVHDQTS